ncbi:MAG: hypothetical protein WC947_04520 [Elusimicrobiota bacterium]
MTQAQVKENQNVIREIIESQVKDNDLIIKAGKVIDNLRNRYGKSEKAFNSTEILRKIREVQLR